MCFQQPCAGSVSLDELQHLLGSHSLILFQRQVFLSQRQLFCLALWFHLVGIKHKQRQDFCLGFYVDHVLVIRWQGLAQDLPNKLHRLFSSNQHNNCFPECMFGFLFFSCTQSVFALCIRHLKRLMPMYATFVAVFLPPLLMHALDTQPPQVSSL